MTYFSESWAYDVRARLSNPKWTVGLTGVVSVVIHCIFLFFVLPFTPAQIPIDESFGQVSIQLVASKPPSSKKSRPAVVETPQKMVEPPKEIVKEIAPAPIPAPVAPVVPVVAAMPVQEIQEQVPEPSQTEPEPAAEVVSAAPIPEATELAESPADPLPVTASDAQPSTGSQSNNDQEIQVSAPLYSSNPKPVYPLAAQRAWNEGRVVLRVSVSETGDVISLSVDKSSGYRILDMAAERAVKKWKFIPARRGHSTIRSECIVPITFHLGKGVSLE